jgi:hypothetical protein
MIYVWALVHSVTSSQQKSSSFYHCTSNGLHMGDRIFPPSEIYDFIADVTIKDTRAQPAAKLAPSAPPLIHVSLCAIGYIFLRCVREKGYCEKNMSPELYWHSAGNIGSLKYTCGYCGATVASDQGWYTFDRVQDEDGEEHIRICPGV